MTDPTAEQPALTVLSLGAGVQSTTLLLLAAEGRIGPLGAAIFADTQSEPADVYAHLDRIEREVAHPAGIPIHRVTEGNLVADALDPEHRFASMPLFVKNQDGGAGMMRRQCTSEYKIKPIKKQVRQLLGYPFPTHVPRGVYAETWIGFSTDEIGRVHDSDVKYMRHVFPLLDLGMSRADCLRYLASHGFASTPKSACAVCPFHGNRQWRHMRDEQPEDWAKAVAFDREIRRGGGGLARMPLGSTCSARRFCTARGFHWVRPRSIESLRPNGKIVRATCSTPSRIRRPRMVTRMDARPGRAVVERRYDREA